MAIRWKIPFAPIRGNTTYTVNVYDEDYTGEPVILTGAANPFETEEDDTEDFFLPVRPQSGYMRIVDNGKDLAGAAFDWRTLIPDTDLSRKVTLTNANSRVLWRGYLQPQTFSGRLYEDTQEREFPVCCPLRVLEGIDVDTGIRGIRNFAYLLQRILEATGHDWRHLYFSGTSTMLTAWLRKKIDWMNFLDEDEDKEIMPKYNYYELLEEMCRFFGWTCRTSGIDIFFLSPDEEYYDALTIVDAQSLDILANDNEPALETVGSLDSIDLDDDIYASIRQDIMLMRGVRKVTLNANINRQDVVVSLPYRDIEDIYKLNTPEDQPYGTNGHYFTLNYPDYIYPHEYTFDDLYIRTLGIGTSSAFVGSSFRVQEWFEGNIAYKHNYSWETVLVVCGNYTPNSHYVTIQSLLPHNYDRGVFVISGGVAQVFAADGKKQSYIASGNLVCRLSIGNRHWSGTEWQEGSLIPHFNLPIGREGETDGSGTGQIIDNRELNGPYNAYTGHGIPISDAMGGIVIFEIMGVELTNTHQQSPYVEISNLEMKFVREKAYAPYNDRDANTYSEENTSVFTDEISIDTIFATNNGNALGLGIIMNRDGSYCENIPYEYQQSSGNERPEEHLVRRMASYGASVRKVATLEVRADSVSLSPTATVALPWGSGVGYPVAISHKWRDDVTTIKIMEL